MTTKKPMPKQTAGKSIAAAIGTLLTGAVTGAVAKLGLDLSPDMVAAVAVLCGALGGAAAAYIKRNYEVL